MPMTLIKTILRTRARFVDPNAATPAGNPNTPAPTIDLTSLNIMVGKDAPSVGCLVVNGVDFVATREDGTAGTTREYTFRLLVEAPPLDIEDRVGLLDVAHDFVALPHGTNLLL
jgi:hypothetical protein